MEQSKNDIYAQLADYYEKQNTKQIKAKQQVVNVKQLIEETNFHKFVPPMVQKKKYSSLGFDVEKFENIMRGKLIEEYKKMQSYERNYISVSELYTCLRNCYYNRMKYPINLDKQFNFSYLYLIQQIGNNLHAAIQKLYDFSETEKPVISEKYQVKGRVDAIKDNFIYEFKSIDEKNFTDTYVLEHFYQGLIYAFILNTEYNYQINTITIVYIMRDFKKIVPIDVSIDNKIAESLLKKAPILLNALKSKRVLDPFGATNESCKYCIYKEQCKKDVCQNVFQPFSLKQESEIKEEIPIVITEPKPKKKKVKIAPVIQEDDGKTAFLL